MRLINSLAVGILAIAGVFSFANSAQAGPIPWSNPNGSTADFDWSNGQSNNGLFGDPIVVGSSFLFFPTNFIATSANGNGAFTTDTLAVDLVIKNNKSLTGFAVHELGDYSILGTGTVSASGLLVVGNTDPNGNGQVVQDSLHTTPVFPVSGTAAGQWTGDSSVTILPNGWTKVHVVLNNILQANAGLNSTAVIQKKFVRGGIEITLIVPEPASISAIGLAGSMLLLRRRK